MEISIARKLRKHLKSESAIKQEYGPLAKTIMLRLNALGAAPTLDDVPRVPPERMHPLHGDRSGQFAVDVGPKWRIVFEPEDKAVPRGEAGEISYTQIVAIRILEVVNYHG